MSTAHRSPSTERHWLTLGVIALAIAGLFSLVLVVARTPSLAGIALFKKLFHEALVVHVDLSVLVWFLGIACLLWHRLAMQSQPLVAIPCLEKSAQISFALGMTCMALSPLDNSGEPLMSNYIPVISNVPFFLGLALVACGVGLMCLRLLVAKADLSIPQNFGIYTAMLITVLALLCFVWSYHLMPAVIEGQQYYELLFWGGGHVLQFTHTQIVMVCWLLLAAAVLGKNPVSRRLARACLMFGFCAAFLSPIAYMLYDVTSMEFRDFFTQKMISLGGIAPAVLSVGILIALFRSPRVSGQGALFSALLCSLLLFAYGGILGMMIHGQNVVIPAHYHGSIVGVTLAFMGVAYYFLPHYGWREVASTRLAFWQPVIYATGQVMHISGLAWSGGYGVLRKTPGALEGGFTSAKAAMGLMGGGGFIAIIGGLMFVIVCWRAMRR